MVLLPIWRQRRPAIYGARRVLQKSQKWPEKNAGGLQNQVRDFNGLARNPIGYRYTIPQRISEQIQWFRKMFGG
jgi:hypothetical protein